MSLQELKSQLLSHGSLKKRTELGQLPGEGEIRFQTGQVIEVLGEHPDAWVIQLLKKIPTARVGWVCHEALELCPVALAQEKLNLSRFLFLENVEAKEGFTKLATFMRSGLFQILVFDQVFFKVRTDVNLRKLQLLAEDHGVGLVMRSLYPTQSFGVHIQVDTRGGQAAQLIKVKGRTL